MWLRPLAGSARAHEDFGVKAQVGVGHGTALRQAEVSVGKRLSAGNFTCMPAQDGSFSLYLPLLRGYRVEFNNGRAMRERAHRAT